MHPEVKKSNRQFVVPMMFVACATLGALAGAQFVARAIIAQVERHGIGHRDGALPVAAPSPYGRFENGWCWDGAGWRNLEREIRPAIAPYQSTDSGPTFSTGMHAIGAYSTDASPSRGGGEPHHTLTISGELNGNAIESRFNLPLGCGDGERYIHGEYWDAALGRWRNLCR